MTTARGALRGLVLLLACLLAGCPPPPKTSGASGDHLARARRAGKGAADAERVGAWLLAELLAPRGSVEEAAKARAALAKLDDRGVLGPLAKGLDHDARGRLGDAGRAYLRALDRLRTSGREDADLLAWFVADRLVGVQESLPWKEARDVVQRAIDDPGAIGWRARGRLVEWWAIQSMLADRAAGKKVVTDKLFARVAQAHGCLGAALIAGPFGDAAPSDQRLHFAPERPAPWPARFPAQPGQPRPPEIVEATPRACALRAKRRLRRGVFYAQSFIELPAARDLIIAVQGAHAVFIDDHEVLHRPSHRWGSWLRFGVRVRLARGRHRIVARLSRPETSIRVLGPDGRPVKGLVGSADQAPPYATEAPTRLPDPNALAAHLDKLGVAPLVGLKRKRVGHDLDSPLSRYVAAYLAHVDTQDDVASVLIEPLVKKIDEATPMALSQQAVFVDHDPIFARGAARDLARDLRTKAAKRDPGLWGPQLWLALQKARGSKPKERVAAMESVAKRFPAVPAVLGRLAALYSAMGWKVERARALEQAVKRFPTNTGLLRQLLSVHEARGEHAKADALAKRLAELDPTDETAFERALSRADYGAAIAELERIGSLYQDRRDFSLRVAELLERAGRAKESLAKLERAVADDPDAASARLALADARYAAGERSALTDALVDSIRAGADSRKLRAAVELIEGVTDLEPYRRDGRKAIADFQKGGKRLPGAAARVLDYAALWIARDGTARMLEHEIIRVQTREGIAKHVEQEVPRGKLLRMRTIKRDGRVFEPERIAAKPTATMPHLEVGDYIETETIYTLRGDGRGGQAYLSPRWFFREENVSYHHSEYVVIAPRDRKVVIETTGVVPAPTVRDVGALRERRWLVKGSLALPREPLTAPIQEFLPSVRLGWGITLEKRLARLARGEADETPHDPRLVRVARTIADGKLKSKAAKGSADTRARRIYRWVMDNVQPGRETVAAKVITGKVGDRVRAFVHLCRLAGIDARLGLVRDRLDPPSVGPISRAATFRRPAVRIATAAGARWLELVDRFAPYGFLRSSLRGQPAAVVGLRVPKLVGGKVVVEREKTSTKGQSDGVVHEANVKLAADGSATMHLVQRYKGKYAIIMRGALTKVIEARRKDVVEARILGMELPGGRVKKLTIGEMDDLDAPLTLTMDVELSTFGRREGGELRLSVPFLPRLSALADRPTRETPLYLAEGAASHTRVVMTIELPPGARVASALSGSKLAHERWSAEVRDDFAAGKLTLDRSVSFPAGRVQPADYPAFRRFVTSTVSAVGAVVRIKL